MLRSRSFRLFALLAGMGAILYLLVSLYLPSSRRLIFGVDKSSGAVRLVQSHVTFLPPYQFYRLTFEKRDGFAQRDGVIRINSKEGVPVTVAYRLRFGIEGARIPDARRLVDDGWSAWIRARVSEAVSAVTSQIPIEELLSPTSKFNSQRDPLRQTVARHLAASGLKVTAFEVARFDVDREALLKAKRAELRRDARSSPMRVAVFALDGADWELLKELADDDRIPNIKALTQGGTTGSVQTIQPTVSPMLWATVATGLPPDRHGVLDFIDHANNQPVSSYDRHAAAAWDNADGFGRPAEVINWWTAWPPAAATSVYFDTPGGLLPNAIYPPTLAARAQSLAVPVETVGYDQAHRFLNITPAEFSTAVNSGNAADPVNLFRGILAKTWSDHRVAINLYNEQKPLLLMMSYDGTDAVNHLFSPYHPPYREGVSESNYRKFWPTVAAYYSEIDRLIGEWMNALPPDTTVILTSAHGFRWGKARPHQMPNGGAALSDHRNPGIFIAYGQHVLPSRAGHAMSIYDIAPTILSLLGLPQSSEMPGHIATWAFRDLTPITSVHVVSYGEFLSEKPIGTTAQLDPKGYQMQLQAVGHLNDPTRNLTPIIEDEEQPAEAAQPLAPEKWGTYAYYNNLGVELRGKGKLRESMEAFEQAVELNPSRPVPYLNLAMARFDRQMYTDADEAFMQAVAKGLPNAERYFVDYASLYRQKQSPSRAIVLLYKGKETFPQSPLIAGNLGSALVAASRFTEGVPELERALGLQPSSTLVLNNLGIFYAKKNDYARALDYWNRSLAIEPRQPPIRDAANAARARL
jgi:predicted AlkP superfamily phosphohydrolase/phosphomutase/Tfp pilus assembly protein PilF